MYKIKIGEIIIILRISLSPETIFRGSNYKKIIIKGVLYAQYISIFQKKKYFLEFWICFLLLPKILQRDKSFFFFLHFTNYFKKKRYVLKNFREKVKYRISWERIKFTICAKLEIKNFLKTFFWDDFPFFSWFFAYIVIFRDLQGWLQILIWHKLEDKKLFFHLIPVVILSDL